MRGGRDGDLDLNLDPDLDPDPGTRPPHASDRPSHAAPGAQGADLDAARELASRELDEDAAVGREDGDREPSHRG